MCISILHIQKQESYRSITHPHITQWLQQLEKGSGTECVIVYCITAEVRHKRQKTLTNFAATSRVMEDMRNDFKEKELVEGWEREERRRGGGGETEGEG